MSLRLPGRRGPLWRSRPGASGGAPGGSRPCGGQATGGSEESRDDDDAATLLASSRTGARGPGGGTLDWEDSVWPNGAPNLPVSPSSVVGARETLQDDLVCRWCSERAEARKRGTGVCEGCFVFGTYFEKMAECLFQSGMPRPRPALVREQHVGSERHFGLFGLCTDGLPEQRGKCLWGW